MAKLHVSTTINGEPQEFLCDASQSLLDVLRGPLGLTGSKEGCGSGDCGACTVIVDGEAVRSCSFPVALAAGKQITTIEGLGTIDKPHPVQKAFIEEQAAQCGYCINGMVMAATALLQRNPQVGENEVRQALAGNLCRCGTHSRILRAIARAGKEMTQ
jgi:aerobic-type carbon monoxide dehydrogenase small subunit (CoxS/CutS family)